jgi:hypothetical protein
LALLTEVFLEDADEDATFFAPAPLPVLPDILSDEVDDFAAVETLVAEVDAFGGMAKHHDLGVRYWACID